MQHFQKEKVTVMGVAVAHTSTAIASAVPLDLQGVGEACIDLLIQTVATASSTGPIKLVESDTVGGTYTDAAATAFSAFPAVITSNATLWRILIPTAQKNLKRFVKVSYLQGASGTATLSTIGRAVALNEVPTGSTANGTAATIVA